MDRAGAPELPPQRRPLRVRLWRLRTRLRIARAAAAPDLARLLAISGGVTFFLAIFELDNQLIPLLTGALQMAIAPALFWEMLRHA